MYETTSLFILPFKPTLMHSVPSSSIIALRVSNTISDRVFGAILQENFARSKVVPLAKKSNAAASLKHECIAVSTYPQVYLKISFIMNSPFFRRYGQPHICIPLFDSVSNPLQQVIKHKVIQWGKVLKVLWVFFPVVNK